MDSVKKLLKYTEIQLFAIYLRLETTGNTLKKTA